MRNRHESYRLTVDDESRAVAIMQQVGDDWSRSKAPRASSDVYTLQRVGAHAFGCSLDDLRDIEVLWLGAKAGEVLEAVYA